jgi:hypothetical protein
MLVITISVKNVLISCQFHSYWIRLWIQESKISPDPKHCQQVRSVSNTLAYLSLLTLSWLIRHKPAKLEYLQEQVKKIQLEKGEKPREKALVPDVRTRWNSMVAMLDSVFQASLHFVSRN